MEYCSMQLDLLYYLGYQIDEPLPWHSTISRTRQLYPESLFESLFEKVFSLCLVKGMVTGHTLGHRFRPCSSKCIYGQLTFKAVS